MKITKRQRPNALLNRYNQWVIAGKIAVTTGAIDPYNPNGKIASVYRTDNNMIHYSVVGQEYLSKLGVSVNIF